MSLVIKKKKFKIIIISTLVCYFLFFIVFGYNGFVSYLKTQNEVSKALGTKNQLSTEIANLKTTISNFESDSFYTEQVARQELFCGKPDEIVYVLK